MDRRDYLSSAGEERPRTDNTGEGEDCERYEGDTPNNIGAGRWISENSALQSSRIRLSPDSEAFVATGTVLGGLEGETLDATSTTDQDNCLDQTESILLEDLMIR
jgi:hypothetical protein